MLKIMAAQDSEVDGDEGHLTETDDDSCDGDVGAGGRQPPAIRRRGPARARPVGGGTFVPHYGIQQVDTPRCAIKNLRDNGLFVRNHERESVMDAHLKG